MKTVSVLVIGSDIERRHEIKWWLKQRRGITVLGEVSEINGLRLVPQLAPDIVVYDSASPALNPMVVMPFLHGLPCEPQILALLPGRMHAEKGLLMDLGAGAATTLHAAGRDGELDTVIAEAQAIARQMPEPTWADLLG